MKNNREESPPPQNSEAKKPLYVFIHLVKTGGSTILHHLENNLSAKELLTVYSHGPKFKGPQNSEAPEFKKGHFKNIGHLNKYLRNLSEKQKSELEVIHGHLVYYGIHKHFPERDVRYITFFRDPVSQAHSLYNFLYIAYEEFRKKGLSPTEIVKLNPGIQTILHEDSLLGFEDWILVSRVFTDNMSRRIINDKQERPPTAAQIKSVLDNFYFIGTLQSFDQDFKFLCHQIGIPSEYSSRNITKDRLKQLGLKKQKPSNESFVNQYIQKKSLVDIQAYHHSLALNKEFKNSHPDFQHFANTLGGEKLVQKSDSEEKNKILVVEERIPTPNQDSGSLRLYEILKILSRWFDITFWPTKKYGTDPKILTDLGIRVIVNESEGYDFLQQEGASFSHVVLSRPSTVDWGITKLKQSCPNATFIYDTVDLHYLRINRQAELVKDPVEKKRLKDEAKRYEIIEWEGINSTDRTWVVSEVEQEIINGKKPNKTVDIVSNIHDIVDTPSSYENTEGLYFIGNFNHTPNVDGVLWFIKRIWPKIHQQLPNAKFTIVGSHLPEKIQKRHGQENIVVAGFVEDLAPILNRSRVFVAPLRFGAGVKGKIGQALGHGIPTVTTSIGAEGFGFNGEELITEDDADRFAEEVVRLYSDKILWESYQKKGQAFIQDKMSTEKTERDLQAIFQPDKKMTPQKQPQKKSQNLPHAKGKIIFPLEASPTVSIIIPVHNQWQYTFDCCKSILQNTSDVSYEIIIADDASSDQTKQLHQFLQNVTHVRNEPALRFTKNVNHAAKHARGEFLFLLNNDTLVQPKWLSSIIDTFKQLPEAGMIGSKLIFPDNTLQEAGGIVWNDGSAWNYGRGDDPSKPEYNYLKPVDYISGAAICIRHYLWKSLGGFDENFAPAYYEDTDLAFQVRDAGYEVFLQPQSQIIHFEGISHGSDISQGLKQYQVKNQKTFFQKWKSVLKQNHLPPSKHLFLARDRSNHKPCVALLPKNFKVENLVRTLQTLQPLGYNIKLLLEKPIDPKPLANTGVEIPDDPVPWLNKNAKHVDFLWLWGDNLPENYASVLKKNPSIRPIKLAEEITRQKHNRISNKQRFIIFSIARCGSTSLREALNFLFQDVLHEPFSPKGQNALQKIIRDKIGPNHAIDNDKVLEVLELLHENFRGFKHVIGNLPTEQNYKILSAFPHKVILLHRKNQLQQAISFFVSKHSNEWVKNKDKVLNAEFPPFPIQEITEHMQRTEAEFLDYEAHLKAQEVDYIKIAYEDLYGVGIQEAQKVQVLRKILDFLVDNNIENEEIELTVQKILGRERKLNSSQTYNRIPNIQEIRNHFGCDENLEPISKQKKEV